MFGSKNFSKNKLGRKARAFLHINRTISGRGGACNSATLYYLKLTPTNTGEKPILKRDKFILIKYRPHCERNQNNLKYRCEKHT